MQRGPGAQDFLGCTDELRRPSCPSRSCSSFQWPHVLHATIVVIVPGGGGGNLGDIDTSQGHRWDSATSLHYR